MELYELKYFLGVARFENIHRASEKLNVSTGSLSKAISRLEDDLGVRLFFRERRNIKLTSEGRVLQKHASQMIQLEDSLRVEVAGQIGSLQIVIAGPEILLSKYSIELSDKITAKYASARFEFQSCSEAASLIKLNRGEAHFAIITGDLTASSELSSKVLESVQFQIYVGRGHALYLKAKSAKVVSIEEVLKHSFVSPDNPLFGKVGIKQSLDGWRDDQFPRKISYITSSLKVLENVIVSGQAIAYLPKYFCENLEVLPLKVSGCPYTCQQKIKLVANRPKDVSWINQIF